MFPAGQRLANDATIVVVVGVLRAIAP